MEGGRWGPPKAASGGQPGRGERPLPFPRRSLFCYRSGGAAGTASMCRGQRLPRGCSRACAEGSSAATSRRERGSPGGQEGRPAGTERGPLGVHRVSPGLARPFCVPALACSKRGHPGPKKTGAGERGNRRQRKLQGGGGSRLTPPPHQIFGVSPRFGFAAAEPSGSQSGPRPVCPPPPLPGKEASSLEGGAGERAGGSPGSSAPPAVADGVAAAWPSLEFQRRRNWTHHPPWLMGRDGIWP